MKKLYGVIGDPIKHSMSPEMHNQLFQLYRIDAAYVPLEVKETNLADAIRGFRAIGAAGFNVTIPHKTEIIKFLDRIDPLAEAIGAVNTVVNENGKLAGYNTDGLGFVKGVGTQVSDLKKKRALIIGAGGAARAIYFSMAEAGITQIDICNRTSGRAEILVKECPISVETNIVDFSEAEKELQRYDLVIQTTSIGMSPNIDHKPFSARNVSETAFVSDIIYNPLETSFLREAKEKGASVQNGINMFVCQGALAFEKWTGIFPDTEIMKETVQKRLGGPTC
ncbi:shikimate dehydrogenase [Mesobacillus harenae]|uniref:shikimate dehydrogenase n=1 Tax=Mesobacillus harenae TaxID=2213203 RepID=UPI0015809EAD